MEMSETLLRLAHGAEALWPKCPRCQGTGLYRYCASGLDEDETGFETCPACGGSGLDIGNDKERPLLA